MSTEPNYTLAAFKDPLHAAAVVVIGAVLLLTLGWTGLILAFLLEAAYLILVPRMIPFRRRVALASRSQVADARRAARELRAAKLTRDVRRRWAGLVAVEEALLRDPDRLPVSQIELDELMDGALSVLLVVEAAEDAERRAPLAELGAQGEPREIVEEREALAQRARDALAQAAKMEATLRRIQGIAADATLGRGDSAALSRDIEAAARTAQEMAAFDLERR